MVIKSKIFEYLKRYLDEYLYGFQKDQLEVALLSGHINLNNVNFKPNKVNALFVQSGLPFQLKAGLIGKLSFKYHYTSWSSNPLELEIDDLLLIIGPILNKRSPSSNPLLSSPGADHELPSDIFKLPNQVPLPKRLPPSHEKPKSAMDEYFSKVIKNLTLHVRRVVVRFEDETYTYKHPYAFGFCIDSIQVITGNPWKNTVNGKDKIRLRPNATAKDIQVSNAFVYAVSMSSMLVPTSLWEDTLHSNIGIFEAIAAYEIRELILEEIEIMKNDPNSMLISPFNSQMCLVMENPGTSLAVRLDPLKVSISSASAEIWRNFQDYCTNCQLWWFVKRYRPRCSIPIYEECTRHRHRKNRRIIIRQWFRYVLKFIRAKKQLFEFIKRRKAQLEKEKEKPTVKKAASFISPRPQAQSSLMGISPMRRTPTKQKPSLNQICKEYNQNILRNVTNQNKPIPKSAAEALPSYVQNSEISLKVPCISLVLYDTDSAISFEFSIGDLFGSLKTHEEEVEMHGHVRHWSGQLGKNRILQSSDLILEGVYRPGVTDNSGNVFESNLRLTPIKISYSNTNLTNLLVLYESFKLDKELKNNIDQRMVEFFRERKDSFIRYSFNQIQIRKKSLIHFLVEQSQNWATDFRKWIVAVDKKCKSISYECVVNTDGIDFEFLGKHSEASHCFSLPSGHLVLRKSGETSEVNCWGIGWKSNQNLEGVLDYFSGLNRLLGDKIEYFRGILMSVKTI